MSDNFVRTEVLLEDGIARTINIYLTTDDKEGEDNVSEHTVKESINESAEGEDSTFTSERFAGDANTRAWDTNLKALFETVLVQLNANQSQRDTLDKISVQALQNAVTQANLVVNQTIKHTSDTDAQKVRHADIAIEGQWPDVSE